MHCLQEGIKNMLIIHYLGRTPCMLAYRGGGGGAGVVHVPLDSAIQQMAPI